MLLSIVIREIFESIYSYRFLFFLLIGITLIPMGFYVNDMNYSKRLNDYDEQVKLEANAVSSAQVWDLLSGNVPLKGFLKPSPLAVFAQGLESSLPQFYTFRPSGYERGTAPTSSGSTSSELGILDFSFMVQLVISLIVLIFGADVISGEKELGTLKLALSNNVSRNTILFGKLIGGYATILFSFAVAFTVGISVLSFISFPLNSQGMLTRILLIFVTSALFVLIYFSIGVMISSSTTRTRTSLIAIIVAWAFLQLIVPKISSMMAALIYPIKTETVVSMEKSIVVNALENEKSKVLGIGYQEIFGADSALPLGSGSHAERVEWNSFSEKVMQGYKEKEALQIHSIDEAYDIENETQQSIELGISLCSPSEAFNYLITGLCSTGMPDKEKYVQSVKTYQHTLDQKLFNLVERANLTFPNGRTATGVTFNGVPDLKSLPVFSVQQAGLSEIFSSNVGSLVSLAFWLIVPFAIAYKRFSKYDVR